MCGGFEVASASIGGRRAYLKPLTGGKFPTMGVAAREKIASDLAFDLGMPVPPVVLFRRADAAKGEAACCCLSLIQYPTQFSREVINKGMAFVKALEGPINEHMPYAAARMLAFDTWVLQHEHDHPANCAFGYDFRSEHGRGFTFFDFAYSMGFGLPVTEAARLFREWGPVPFPQEMKMRVDKSTLHQAILAIQQYPEEKATAIINRIPDDFILAEDKEMIAEGLIARRARLESILYQQLR